MQVIVVPSLQWTAKLHQNNSPTPLSQRKRMRKHEDKELVDGDKDGYITHQLASETKQSQHWEINVIYCLLIAV